MKLILKENPNKELTVTIEYPEENKQLQRIVNKLEAEDFFLVGNDNGRNYKVFVPEIYYIESVDKRTFIYTRDRVFRTEKRLHQLEKELGKYDFIKVNRNCLLNINELLHLEALGNSRLDVNSNYIIDCNSGIVCLF